MARSDPRLTGFEPAPLDPQFVFVNCPFHPASNVTMTADLLTGMLIKAYDTEQATAIIDYRLDQLFIDP